MPNEVVWVDKIINPRSVVLTYNEAMNVLKKAKTASGRSQFIAAECKPSTSTTSVKIEDQKNECLKFVTMHAYEMETKPLIKMQEELRSISASKIAFNEAVNKRFLHADGLPRLKPSVSLKINLLKHQKDKKKNTINSNLRSINRGAINKEAVKNLYNDKDDDDMVVFSPSESEPEVTEEPVIKRKRIVISDDEDIEDNVEHDPPTSSTNEEIPKLVEVLQNANNIDIFKKAFTTCIEASSTDPITISFEAHDDKVNVIASSSNVHQIIKDTEIPSNDMFSDEAVSSLLNLPINPTKNFDEALKSFCFGKTEEDPRKSAISSAQNLKKPNIKMLQKLPYAELVKDKKFCSKLLETVESDNDVTPFLDITIEKYSKESEFLPRQSILNSLFSLEDLEMMQYKKEMEKFDSNLYREKQRIQHPFVKVKPSSNLKLKTAKSNIQKSNINPKSKEIEYGVKGILKKFNSADPTLAQTSMKNQLISHNTVIHEALKYLLKNKSTQKIPDEIKAAYDKLNKYPLTFLEKLNLVTTMPKDLSGILCLLDDLGLRFGKESLDKLEADCISIFENSNKRETDDEEESEKMSYDLEGAKKVRFSKTVEHRFM